MWLQLGRQSHTLSRRVAENGAFDEVADDVLDGQVGFLDMLSIVAGNADTDVGQLAQSSTGGAGETDCRNPNRFGYVDRTDYILRRTAGADSEEHVAGFAEGLHLAGEDAFEIEVIGIGREKRRVGGEGDGRQTGTDEIWRQSAGEFGGHVLTIARATAVAA